MASLTRDFESPIGSHATRTSIREPVGVSERISVR